MGKQASEPVVEVLPARTTAKVRHAWLPVWSELAAEARELGIDPEPFDNNGSRKALWLAIQGAKLYQTSKRGGKPMLDLDLIDEICEHIKHGVPQGRAAGACGVSRTALTAWKAKGEAEPDSIYGTLLTKLQQAEDQAVCTLVQKVVTSDKNWRGSAWILERRFSKEFSRPAPIFVSAPGEGQQAAPQIGDLLRALTSAPDGIEREVRLVHREREPAALTVEPDDSTDGDE